jgi:hypothetical protein
MDKYTEAKFWGTLGVAIVGLIVLATILGVADSCASGFAAVEIKKKAAAGCGEFWLNRYQTLITGILAVGAATVTIYFTRRQVAEAQKLTKLEFVRQLQSEESNLVAEVYTIRFSRAFDDFKRELGSLEDAARRSSYNFETARFQLDTVERFFGALDHLIFGIGDQILSTDMREFVRKRIELTRVEIEPALRESYRQYCSHARIGAQTQSAEQELQITRMMMVAAWEDLPAKLAAVAEAREAKIKKLRERIVAIEEET